MNYVVGGKSNIPNDAENLSLELSDVQHRKGSLLLGFNNVQETKCGLHLGMLYMAPNRGQQQIAQKMGLPLKFINKRNTVAHCLT